MGAISEAIRSAAEEAGATIVRDATVDDILHDEKSAHGVRLDDGEVIRGKVKLL